MSILRFKPQIWAAVLQAKLEKSLVYAGPGVVNRDYEGEISQAGDSVKITSISDPTIGDYVPGSTTITPEDLTDAQRTLLVDQSKYFAFRVDDVDKRQAAGNVMSTAMERAAYKLKDTADQYVASLYTGASTSLDDVTLSSTVKVYDDVLVALSVALDEMDVPSDGRYCVVAPWIHGQLLLDDRFVKVNESGSDAGLRNGVVGRAVGFDILKSNNTPSPASTHNVVTAGHPMAISYAEQINKTEAYRPESSFSDAVKGLHLYGAKVVYPDALAAVTVIPAS